MEPPRRWLGLAAPLAAVLRLCPLVGGPGCASAAVLRAGQIAWPIPGQVTLPKFSRVEDTYEPSDVLGSISPADSRNTETVVHEGLDNVTKALNKAKTTIDLAEMTCAQIYDVVKELELKIERGQVEALEAKFEASQFNSGSSKNILKEKRGVAATHRAATAAVRDKNVEAVKTMDQFQSSSMQLKQIIEQYSLKCGAITDRLITNPGASCARGQRYILDDYRDLKEAREHVLGLATEAGWLAAEAEQLDATEKMKKAADLKLHEAKLAQDDLWEREESLAAAINVKAAACGVVEPAGDWATIGDGCGFKPNDPLMKALLRDNPGEFQMHWKKEIGRKAGIDPEFVKVSVTNCA